MYWIDVIMYVSACVLCSVVSLIPYICPVYTILHQNFVETLDGIATTASRTRAKQKT